MNCYYKIIIASIISMQMSNATFAQTEKFSDRYWKSNVKIKPSLNVEETDSSFNQFYELLNKPMDSNLIDSVNTPPKKDPNVKASAYKISKEDSLKLISLENANNKLLDERWTVKKLHLFLLDSTLNAEQEKLTTLLQNPATINWELLAQNKPLCIKFLKDSMNFELMKKDKRKRRTIAEKINKYIIGKYTHASIDSLNKHESELKLILKSNFQHIEELNHTLYRIIEMDKLDKIDKNNQNNRNEAEAKPSFLSTISSLRITPTIELIASRIIKDDKNGQMYAVKLATGMVDSDSTRLACATNFLYPNTSNLIVSVLGTKYFESLGTKTNGLTLNGEFFYLNKTLDNRDSTNKTKTRQTYGVAHVRCGAEYELFPSVFYLYGRINALGVITQSKLFNDYFSTTENFYNFWDAGFRAHLFLNENSKNKTALYIDFNFLLITHSIKPLYNTGDLVLPSLKVGLAQSF